MKKSLVVCGAFFLNIYIFWSIVFSNIIYIDFYETCPF